MQPTGRPVRAASLVYRLAEAVERVCWFAEQQWSRDPEGGEVSPDPEMVEGHLERVVQLADHLRGEAADATLQGALRVFTEDLDRAWGEFQQAWGRPDHLEALRVWEDRYAGEGEFPSEVRVAIVRKSPALQRFQGQATAGFQRLLAALPEALRLLAEVGQLLTRPDYPGAAYDRVIEEAGVSQLRYLRRVLRRDVEERWAVILRHYPMLADLDIRFEGHSEYDCLNAVSRLRKRLGKALARADDRVEGCSDPEPVLENPANRQGQGTTRDTESTAGARKRPRPCARKAWAQFQRAAGQVGEACTDEQAYEWLQKHDEETAQLPSRETWTRYVREVRRLLDRQKYAARRWRTGASVVHASEVETQTQGGGRIRRDRRADLLERLENLAGDIFLSESPTDDTWGKIHAVLRDLELSQEWIDRVVGDRDLTEILDRVKRAKEENP